MPVEENPACRSRRSFLQVSAATAAVAAVGLRIVTEPMLARADSRPFPKDAVIIDANENPLGPCGVACDAVSSVASQGGRYSDWMTDRSHQNLCSDRGAQARIRPRFPWLERPAALLRTGFHLSHEELRHCRSWL